MQNTVIKSKKEIRLEDIIDEKDLPEVIQKLKQSEEEYERGEVLDIDIAFKNFRKKYEY